jgi:predicted metal-dependent phosphotriesterase family hydrolase
LKCAVEHHGIIGDAIADQGAFLGCDRYGIEHFNTTPDRIRTLLALIAEGPTCCGSTGGCCRHSATAV